MHVLQMAPRARTGLAEFTRVRAVSPLPGAGVYRAFCIRPDLMHLVHTRIVLVPPPTFARTF
jgi:hypothetical protein